MENVEKRKQPVYRIVVAIILLALTAFLTYVMVDSVTIASSGENLAGLALLGPIIYAIYGSPVLIFTIIFEIIMIVKKGFSYLSIASILFVLCWVACFVVPQLVN